MQKIMDYLKEKYQPLAIVVYGSFCCGTQDEYSDFDCMIVVDQKNCSHDDASIDGIPLDCFIFTREEVSGEDVDPFLTVYDGKIILDTDGIAEDLKKRVRAYVADHSAVSEEEKEFIISWIGKTMHRAEKNDDEGNYRALSFLWESITDYFLLRDRFYFGSKKAFSWLQENDQAGYQLYHAALQERTNEAIRKWAEYLVKVS